MKQQPTTDFYNLFQSLYNFFNEKLFRKELPQCMIVITRQKNTFGYYISERWINKEKIKCDEIAINPMFFSQYPIKEMMQTIVHEMCHLWQYHFGKPSVRTYHNKEWGEKMESIGLMPSNTGLPGGNKTGQQMMEYSIESGLFERFLFVLEHDKQYKEKIESLWYDRFKYNYHQIEGTENLALESVDQQEKPKNQKIKYSCRTCKVNVWGKDNIEIICGKCSNPFLIV